MLKRIAASPLLIACVLLILSATRPHAEEMVQIVNGMKISDPWQAWETRKITLDLTALDAAPYFSGNGGDHCENITPSSGKLCMTISFKSGLFGSETYFTKQLLNFGVCKGGNVNNTKDQVLATMRSAGAQILGMQGSPANGLIHEYTVQLSCAAKDGNGGSSFFNVNVTGTQEFSPTFSCNINTPSELQLTGTQDGNTTNITTTCAGATAGQKYQLEIGDGGCGVGCATLTNPYSQTNAEVRFADNNKTKLTVTAIDGESNIPLHAELTNDSTPEGTYTGQISITVNYN